MRPREQGPALWEELSRQATPAGSACWEWLEIHAGIPVILPQTQEQFTPQMANFEAIGGVSFNKGCYTGQEIVARTQYLGKVKRRLYLAHLDSDSAPQPGDELFGAEPTSGMVVNAQPAPDGGYDLLAVIPTGSVEAGAVHFKTPDGPALHSCPCPTRSRADRPRRSQMKITFLGAAQQVTGSCYLIETGEVKFLVDCGMFQGGHEADKLNAQPFKFLPRDIAFVLLTHAHIDHSGLLPKLVAAGFDGPIYTTTATADLLGVMLPDSAHIQEIEASRENRRREEKPREKRKLSAAATPLYTMAEAEICLGRLTPISYDAQISPHPSVHCCFRDAGHILGSSIIEVWVKEWRQADQAGLLGGSGPTRPAYPARPRHHRRSRYPVRRIHLWRPAAQRPVSDRRRIRACHQ